MGEKKPEEISSIPLKSYSMGFKVTKEMLEDYDFDFFGVVPEGKDPAQYIDDFVLPMKVWGETFDG